MNEPHVNAETVSQRGRELAFTMLQHCRPLGLEVGSDLASRLLYLAWLTFQEPDGEEQWRALAHQEPTVLLRALEDLARSRAPELRSIGDLFRFVSERSGAHTNVFVGLTQLIWRACGSGTSTATVVAAFEALLDDASSTSDLRRAGVHGTPLHIADLMASLIGTPTSVFDPVCGQGSTLLAATRRSGAADLHGSDINEGTVDFARMRMAIAGARAVIEHGDAFDVAVEHLHRHDAVIMHPPWDLLLDERVITQLQRMGIQPGLPAPGLHKLDLVWLQLALACLTDGGRAAVLVPPALIQREGLSKWLGPHVEVVISCPAGTLRNTSLSPILLILEKEAKEDRETLLIDTRSLYGTGHRPEPAADGFDSLLEAVAEWRAGRQVSAPAHVALSLRVADLDARFGFTPQAYLRQSPAPLATPPAAAHHLLSHLAISGFKSFGGVQRAPLAPLTLIYGANSAGKSSLMQTLLLLRQSLDSERLVTQGPLTDVGSFSGVRHKHGFAEVCIEVGFGSPVWQLPPRGTPDPSLGRATAFSFGNATDNQGHLQRFNAEFGHHRIEWVRSADTAFATTIDQAEPVFEEIAEGVLLYPFDARLDREPAATEQEERVRQKRRFAHGRSTARSFKRLGISHLSVRWRGLLPSDQAEFDPVWGLSEQRAASVARSYQDRFSRLTAGLAEELRTLLEGLAYLGPLRSAPQRFYDRAANSRPGDGSHVALYLFDNTSVLEQVNGWLSQLEVPYRVDVLPMEVAGASQLMGDLVALTLTDSRSRVTVTPADVGFGISQVLPIVVELCARQDSIVLIEQPETHLHPRLQGHLADLLIESTRSEGAANQLLVETHSEHLMLRVQRRIREGVLDPDSVAVLYVDQNEEGEATVQRLRIDHDGDFLDEWPHGFFDDRLDDLLGGR